MYAAPPPGKTLRQSLKKLWYPRSGLRESQTRIGLFSSSLSIRGSKSPAYRSCSSPAGLGSREHQSLKNRIHRFDVFLYTHIRRVNTCSSNVACRVSCNVALNAATDRAAGGE